MSSHAGVRAFRLLLAVMTVWCLGCDAFDRIVEDAAGQTPIAIRQGTSVAAACATVPGVEALHAYHTHFNDMQQQYGCAWSVTRRC